MADVAEGSIIIKNNETMEQGVDANANGAASVNVLIKNEIIDTALADGGSSHDARLTTLNSGKNLEDDFIKKEIDFNPDMPYDLENQQSGSIKAEEDQDFLTEDFMDNLDVVDSWVDTTDNIEEQSEGLNDINDVPLGLLNEVVDVNLGDKKVDKRDCDKLNVNKDKNKKDDNSHERSSRRISDDKKATDKDGRSTDRHSIPDKRKVGKETTEQSRNKNSDRKGKSPERTLKKEHESRRERSPNRSIKTSDNSRRNTDRGVDRGLTSSSRMRRNSRSRRSRTRSRDRESHHNSRKSAVKEREHNSQRSGDSEHRSSRTTSNQKQDRSLDQDKRSVKSQGSTGKAVTTKATTTTASTGKSTDVNPLKFKKIPLLEVLVPPGTEDDVLRKTNESVEEQSHSPQADTLVPPGTVEVLLPDVIGAMEKQENSSGRKRKASNSDLNKSKSKSGTAREDSRNNKEKQGADKKRRTTSSGVVDIVRKKQPIVVKHGLTGWERVSRDQDRVSRELSLERLRESRNRDRIEKDRNIVSRDGYSQNRRSRGERDGRRASHDSRWETSSRDRFERHRGELSPVSPGRMSRGSPMSFEFSPVSSRSSSRDRLKLEYQRSKFRSYSPISSGSDLSRSMVSISSDEERDPRSRRRRRLPFLDEMERKLGLKLTGGHNINQKLRTSQPFQTTDFNIDMSAPPPGTYPVSYPPPASYTTPFPQAANPIYPTPTFIPIPPIATAPRGVGVTGPPPAICPPANASPSCQLDRHLVRPPRVPQKNITYKFQRPIQNQQPELPEAPPPPTISTGAAKGEMSLSSLLEASVKGALEATKMNQANRSSEVGGKNPVDQDRVQRCQVAIQTLQEDESFSMITLGRFIIHPVPKGTYTPIARFDHPAQESMFKLKSPLLRNQPVSLKFTTPPVVPFKAKVDTVTVEKNSANINTLPLKASSIWPKNSERKPIEKSVEPMDPDPIEDSDANGDDPDVWIVERTETVVSISSESDHDMNLSLVSDISDVSADEGEDKLENVSSGEEDFNQCATCAERNREKKMVNASTQSQNLDKRSVNLQVDFVNKQLVGTCDVVFRANSRKRLDKSSTLHQSIHSNTSSVSSNSSNEPSPSPTNQSQPLASSNIIPDNLSASPRTTAKSFLASVTDQPCHLYSNLPSTSFTNQLSSNQSLSSNYNPLTKTTNIFQNKSSLNQLPISSTNQLNTSSNSSNIDPNKSFQGYKTFGPFRTGNAIKLTTLSSGTMLGVLSKPAPARGILKTTRPLDMQFSSASNVSTPVANDFQLNKFQSSQPFQSGNIVQQQQPFTNQNIMNKQGMGVPPFQAGNMSQQPYRNQSNLNQQGIGGQSFQGGNMPRQSFAGNTSSQNQQGIGGPPFKSFSNFGPQTMNTNFGNRFGNTGNVPTMVPPPTPVPAPNYNQQNFLPRVSGGLGMNSTAAGMNRDQHPTHFNSPSTGQQSNYYEPERY